MLFKKAVVLPFAFLLAFLVFPALARSAIILENAKEAETLRDFFATPYENTVEPINWEEFANLYSKFVGANFGKALLVLDIGADGKLTNLRVLQRNKDLLFDSNLKRFFLERLEFEKGNPQKDVLFEVGFCAFSLCKIHFQRVSGPAEPLIMEYQMPVLNRGQKRKKYCGDVVFSFDVNKNGLAKNLKIISSTIPGQFGSWIKNYFYEFKFEKNKPAKGIELLVRFEALGRCEE